MKKNPKLHLGHFQRVRDRILNSDVHSLDDTLVLEMLLQSPIHRGDTNEIAREILARFGSFNKFCKLARYDDLLTINGVGEAVAEKLMCFVKIFQYYRMQPCDCVDIDATNIREFTKFLKGIYNGYDHEVLLLFILNSSGQVCHYTVLQHGDNQHVMVDLSRISELTRIHKGNLVILSHNHPVGPFYPSIEDFQTTQQIMAYCQSRGIHFLDHIIVSQHGYFSFRSSHLLHAMQTRLMNKLRERKKLCA